MLKLASIPIDLVGIPLWRVREVFAST